LLHSTFQGVNIGEVAVNVIGLWTALPTERFNQFVGGLILNVQKGNARALLRKMANNGLANAGGAAGNQYHPALKAWITGKLRIAILHLSQLRTAGTRD
jgi:hypothetical protein